MLNLPKADPARPKADLTEIEDDDSGVDNVRDRMGAAAMGGCCKSPAEKALLVAPALEGSCIPPPPPSTSKEFMRGCSEVVGSDGKE